MHIHKASVWCIADYSADTVPACAMAKGRGRGGMHPYSSAQSVSKGGVFEVFASAVFGKGAASREAHERSYLFDGSPTGQLDGSTTYATETDKPKRDPPAGEDGLSCVGRARGSEASAVSRRMGADLVPAVVFPPRP